VGFAVTAFQYYTCGLQGRVGWVQLIADRRSSDLDCMLLDERGSFVHIHVRCDLQDGGSNGGLSTWATRTKASSRHAPCFKSARFDKSVVGRLTMTSKGAAAAVLRRYAMSATPAIRTPAPDTVAIEEIEVASMPRILSLLPSFERFPPLEPFFPDLPDE
jgi:hypothetical protein